MKRTIIVRSLTLQYDHKMQPNVKILTWITIKDNISFLRRINEGENILYKLSKDRLSCKVQHLHT